MKVHLDGIRGLKMAAVMALVASIPRIIRLDLADLSPLFGVYVLLLLLIWVFWIATVAVEAHFHGKPTIARVLVLVPVWIFFAAIFHVFFGNDGKSGAPLFRPVDAGVVSAWQTWMIVCFRGSVFGVLVFVVVRFLRLNEEKQRRELELKQLRQSELEAQLTLMQQQISPHFLFNSLSTLRSISSEPATREYILKMAQVYRYLLRKNDQNLVTLEEELELTEAYVFIMQQRFEGCLVLRTQVSAASLQMRLPPLTLQILVENAIKHNVITVSKPLTVEVYSNGVSHLIVRNRKQQKIMIEPGTGTGLANIRSRYAILSGKSIEINESEDWFEVVLPLLSPCTF